MDMMGMMEAEWVATAPTAREGGLKPAATNRRALSIFIVTTVVKMRLPQIPHLIWMYGVADCLMGHAPRRGMGSRLRRPLRNLPHEATSGVVNDTILAKHTPHWIPAFAGMTVVQRSPFAGTTEVGNLGCPDPLRGRMGLS